MKTEQELLKQFKEENLNLYRLKDFIQNENKIELDSIEELIRFAHNNNINNMFYFYYYLNGRELLIDEKVVNKFRINQETITILENEFMEYNKNIVKLDFSNPVGVTVYCVFDGIIFKVDESDCIIGIDIEAPEEACQKIIKKHLEKIKEYEKENSVDIQGQREQLKEEILNDKEFHRCTNGSLRTSYANRVIRKNDVNRKLFMKESGEWYDIPINDFIELLWREYKEISKPTIITTLRKEDLI